MFIAKSIILLPQNVQLATTARFVTRHVLLTATATSATWSLVTATVARRDSTKQTVLQSAVNVLILCATSNQASVRRADSVFTVRVAGCRAELVTTRAADMMTECATTAARMARTCGTALASARFPVVVRYAASTIARVAKGAWKAGAA